MNKTGMKKPLMWTIIFVLVAAVFLGGYWVVQNAPAGAPLAAGGSNPAIQNVAPAAGACTPQALSASQTPSFTVTQADKAGVTISPTSVIYGNIAQRNSVVTTTLQCQQYTALLTNTSYLGSLLQFTTPAGSTAPTYSAVMEKYDSSISFTAYNSGGHTANAITANQSLSAGSSATMDIEMTPGSLYTHIAGGPSNQFVVFFNATNVTNWDVTKFTATAGSGWSTGLNCVPYASGDGLSNHAVPTALTNQMVVAFTCTGDWSGQDTAVHQLNFGIGASTNYNTGGTVATLNIIPVDFYQNTITGAVEFGAVKNDGSAIQTGQSVALFLK